MDRRYAVYAAPPGDSALARWGAGWLGRDAEHGVVRSPPALAGWCAAGLARVTAAPRLYGLHATLKPPFRLAAGKSEAGLCEAIERLAQTQPAPRPSGLRLAALDRFLALVPDGVWPDIHRLADSCIESLDRFRAQPGAAELARRQSARLTPRQSQLLARWGYPYVFDTYRFHISLSGALMPEELARLHRDLEPLVRPVLAEQLCLADIALFVQDDAGAFRLERRFRFG